VGIGIEGDGIYPVHIDPVPVHDAFVCGHVHDLSDDAAAVCPILVFNEGTFQAEGEFVDHWSVHEFGPAGSEAAVGKFIRSLISGFHPEIIGLCHMGSIGDAYGEGTSCLDVF